MQTRRLTILGLVVAAMLVFAAGPAWAATLQVTSTGSSGDAVAGDGSCSITAAPGGACTLRAAIEESNATSSGAPYTIDLSLLGSPIQVLNDLPAITRNGTFVDGCGVGRAPPPTVGADAVPNPPSTDPCVGLINTNVVPTTGLTIKGAADVVIQGLAMTNFARAVRLWGSDRAEIRGNWFGVRVDGATQEGNDVAVSVTDRTQDGAVVDPALANIVGGSSDATDSDFPSCTASFCNLIVNSKKTGIDLAGTPSVSGPGDAPSSASGIDEGTQVRGNWIGVEAAGGTPAAPNATAISIGNSQNAVIGGDPVGYGNVIAGNTNGVDQGSGSRVVWLLGGLYGMSPDQNRTVTNHSWNARLHGGPGPNGVVVDHALFGPADRGIDLEGPMAQVTGSAFFSPDGARFDSAAIYVGPGADDAFLGSAAGAQSACAPLVDNCNSINHTKPGAPGIWINGADNARIKRNAIGAALFSPPLDGPPIRIDGGATGARVGDDNDNPDERNVLTRSSGPAIAIGEGATRILVGDNEGLSLDGSALFTDLSPAPGLGNSGPENSGIQPPVITLATTTGVGGTAIPGATIRVLQQQRAPVQGEPNTTYQTGYTFPTSPSVATANADGVWGIAFPAALKTGQKLLASQTTADGSSEYASPQAATATNPPPLVTFTSGPPTVVGSEVRSATFEFTSNKAGSTFTCSLDAGAFVACKSPYTVNGLDTGGHQLQVKATDPIGKQGPPASRNWSILFANPAPAPPSPPVAASAAVRFASLVTLPSAKACISKRSMRITVRTPKGTKVKGVVIRIAGKKVGSAKSAKTIPISLKGLKRGKFVVKVEVTLTDGRVIKGSRTYRTCAKKAAKRRAKR